MIPDQPPAGSGDAANEHKKKVLIINDADAMRQFMRTLLNEHGYEVHEAAVSDDVITKTIDLHPDIILLDLGFPGVDSTAITQRIREWTEKPILVLAMQDGETDKIETLDAGADDYITKPFSMGELAARLRAAIRHSAYHQMTTSMFMNGRLVVNLNTRTVYCDGQEVRLTPTEYNLLKVLVQNAGRALSHRQILKKIRGAEFESDTHLLQVHIRNLRRKLEADPSQPQYILTVPGIGYRFSPKSQPE
jgi:two-component system KDP operon response regulator KdpE